MSLRDTPERRQLEQWLNSYVSLRGHEPFAHEITEFLERNEARNSRGFRPVSPATALDMAANVSGATLSTEALE